MSHSNTTGYALLLLLLSVAGCERRQAATRGGMVSDSSPPMAGDTARPQPGKPAPLPAEPTPAGTAGGGMADDTAARRPGPAAGDKPVPMPGEPRPSAGR
jgi:hypothetical protein